jgi:hypothetical protein
VTIHQHSQRTVVEFDGPYGPLHIERSCRRTLKHFKRPPDFAPPTFAPVEMKAIMPVFDFPRITILPDAEGRKMVRATVVNQRTRATMTIWEYIDGARVLESNFARFRRTRFSAPLKQFLLADLDADVVARLIENGGYEARLTERYRELLTDLERAWRRRFRRRRREPHEGKRTRRSVTPRWATAIDAAPLLPAQIDSAV